jgi:cytochrome c biogenesis factor
MLWLLDFIPNSWIGWAVHGTIFIGLLVGIIGSIAGKIPLITQYGVLMKAVGILLLLLGIFFEGCYITETNWQSKMVKIKENTERLEAQVKESEKKAKTANVALIEERKKKLTVVKEVQVVIQDRIVESAAKIDADCVKVNPIAIGILNDAAKNVKGNKK